MMTSRYRAGQGRAGQGRAGQGRAGQDQAKQSLPDLVILVLHEALALLVQLPALKLELVLNVCMAACRHAEHSQSLNLSLPHEIHNFQ